MKKFESKDEELGLLLKFVHQALEKDLNKNAAEIGLTYSQCHVMGFLHSHAEREFYPMDLEKALELSKPTVTGLLQRLEEKDFISLVPDKRDKRYKKIVLTEKAWEFHEKMQATLCRTQKKLYKNISEEEKDEVIAVLHKMLGNIKGKEEMKE